MDKWANSDEQHGGADGQRDTEPQSNARQKLCAGETKVTVRGERTNDSSQGAIHEQQKERMVVPLANRHALNLNFARVGVSDASGSPIQGEK